MCIRDSTGESARRIRDTIDATVKRPVPWEKKHDTVLFRGGSHGFGSEMYQRDGLTDAQALALLGAEGADPARAEVALESARSNQRVELAVWANSPANELRDHLDVKVMGSVAHHHAYACYYELEEVVRMDHAQYRQAAWGANKAFFTVDGTGVSASLRSELALDSVVLKMESTLTQEIERVVLPGVHYMPFTMQNVSEVVRYVLAEENAAEMQAMVRRAHTALAEELTLEKGAERMRDDLVRLWAGTGATPAARSG